MACFLLAFAMLHSDFCLLLCRADPQPVVVRLRAVSTAPTRALSVGDVAELSGGLPLLRDSIARLDLIDVPPGKTTVTVSRKQLLFRLGLAGLPPDTYRVAGPESGQANLELRPILPDEVVAAARQALLARLPWRPEEVVIDLVQPVLAPLPQVTRDETVAIKAELHQGGRPVGRVQMDVRIFVQGESRLALAVYFHVRPCQKAVVCRRRIEKGEALGEDNVYVEDQPAEPKGRFALSPDAVKGAKARQTLLPGQVVMQTDVETKDTGGHAPLVKAQEAVKIQIRLGALKVTAAGQALQEGRQGQLIRVQNVDSKKLLLGRVVAAGLVEVE